MNKKKKLLIVLLALLLCSSVGAAFFVFRGKTKTIKEGVASDLLYWNVEGKMYTQSGDSTREKAEDGFYHVLFAVEGAIAEYKVYDDELMQQIDSEDIMGLVINEDDIITGTLDVTEVTAGEIASYCYVMSSVDGKVVANSASKGQGMETVFEVTSATNIYDVSGKADFVGEKTEKVSTFDRVRAFINEKQEVTHVYIIGHFQSYNCETEEGWCDHCQQMVEWMLWEEVDELPVRSGHFRLMYDVMLPDIQAPIEEDESVIVDLNGHTATGPYNLRVFALFFENSYLAILDQSPLETGTLIAEGATDEGGVVWVRYGTFELFSGTLDASGVESVLNGSAVYVNPDTTFNMYGGTIIGGTAKANIKTGQTGVRGGYAGSVCVASNAVFNMYDGVIKDGKAVSYTDSKGNVIGGQGGNIWACDHSEVNIYGGKILDGTAEIFAGNFLIATDATVTMKDGTISGGKVSGKEQNGGNLVIGERGVLNLEGGTISDGMSLNCGANIALYGILNMSGGTIKDGKHMEGTSIDTAKQVLSDDENVFCVNGTINMTGGHIAGHVEILDHGTDSKGKPKECTVNLSGSANISGGKTNLTLYSGDQITLGTLNSSARIYITGKGYVSTDTIAANKNYIFSDYEGVNAHYFDNKIFIGELHCICGQTDGHIGACDGSILEWLPWTTTDSAPIISGNWYLTQDLSVERQQGIDKDVKLCLDLNGYQIKGASGERVYNTYSGNIDFTITDSSPSKTGRIVAQGDSIQNGGVLWITKDSVITLYAGVLDATDYRLKHNGAALFVDSGSKFVMYGGTIQGGQSLINEKGIYGFGGAAYIEGDLAMYGGTICGGHSEWSGGNVAVNDGGNFLFAGGTITSGKAEVAGGNVYVLGSMQMTGGVMCDGYAEDNAGNLYVAQQGRNGEQYGTVELKGGEIYKGKTKNTGGNVYIEGIFDMSAGIIRDGVAEGNADTANVYYYQLQSRDSFKMSGGSIQGMVTMFSVDAENTNFELSGTANIKGATYNLVIPCNYLIRTGKLENTAQIYVTATGEFAYCTNAENARYFHIDDWMTELDPWSLKYDSDHQKLVIDQPLELGDCICGLDANGKHFGDCDGELLLWAPWRSTTSLPNSEGNYYLVNDVVVNSATGVSGKVNLDLNGKTVTNPESRIYQATDDNAVLSITDRSEDKDGKLYATKTGDNNEGGILMILDGGTINLYNGVLDASGSSRAGNTQGNAVWIGKSSEQKNSGGNFNMHGGSIVGNSNPDAYYALNVHVSDGTFRMTGGTISGGYSRGIANIRVEEAGSMDLQGGSIEGVSCICGLDAEGHHYGDCDGTPLIWTAWTSTTSLPETAGNYYLVDDVVVTSSTGVSGKVNLDLNGKTVTNPESRIYQATDDNAVLSITDRSEDKDGKLYATKTGDNNEGGILMILDGGTINLYNGVLDASGSSRAGNTQGNAVWIGKSSEQKNSGGNFNMHGGSIVGNSNPDAYYALNVHVSDGTFRMTGGTISGGYSKEIANILVEAAGTMDLQGGSIEGVSCICGLDVDGKHYGDCDGTPLIWKAWTSTDSLPRTSGNYYLTQDVTLAGQTGLDDEGLNTNLDLTGHRVQAASSRVFISIGQNNIVLNITDLSEDKGGKIVCTHTGDAGSIFYMTGAVNIHLYGGTLDASIAKDAVVLYNTSSFHIHGGALLGGSADRGGSVHLEDSASFYMTGGSITGGRAVYNGGNVYSPYGTAAYLLGGTIQSGSAGEDGHNVFGNGKLTLKGTTIGTTKITSAVEAQNETTLVIGGNAVVNYE